MVGTRGDSVVVGVRGRSRAVRGYDSLAPFYRAIETLVFGGGLQRARVALLDPLPSVERILVLGDGDGRLLQALAERQRRATIISIDQSDAMLARQRQRLNREVQSGRVRMIRGDVGELDQVLGDESNFDLIVAAFLTDCFQRDELDRVWLHWLGRLRPGGTVYHVDFVMPPSGIRRWRAKLLSAIMHRFFAWQTGLESRELVPRPTQMGPWRLRVLAEVTSRDGFVRSEWLAVDRQSGG